MKQASSSLPSQRGFSLIDVLLVIVLMGIVASGVATVAGQLAAQSALSVKTRQAIALAQGLLEEVRHAPFTYCDPIDTQTSTATTVADCTTQVDGMGPEPGESRYNAGNRFDGVTDYDNFVMPGPGCPAVPCDRGGPLPAVTNSTLAGCVTGVTVATQALPAIPAADAVRIVVTVRCPGLDPVRVDTVRVRHAPNAF